MSDIVVTILLALLTGVLALCAALVTRGNLVSGFRQNWINDQRNDLAAVASKATVLSSNLSPETWSRDMEGFAAAFARIRLRENPVRREWKDVIAEIRALHEELWNNRNSAHDVTDRLLEIDAIAQVKLKEDWTKTRNGEDGYRRGIWMAIAALVFVTAALVYIWITNGNEEKKDNKAAGPVVVQNFGQMPAPPVLPPPAPVAPPEAKPSVPVKR